tara:strand:- start:3502 stop:4887 length:1386 start_codon:yes stop_codon:yes gene_type:complete
MYTKYFENLKGIILPHAGIQYAGPARNNIFQNLTHTDKQITKIIYLSALHDSRYSSEEVFILENNSIFDNYFENTKCKYNIDYLSDGAKNEHSYKWVKDELLFFFKNTKILVICPTPLCNHKDLAIDIINYISNENEKIILISTTDLIHYGDRFNNLDFLEYPYTYNKIMKEENTIDNLLNNRLTNYDENIMCGRYAIKTFLFISKYYNWNARVIDYYDSSMYNENNIKKHEINFNKEKKEFVSYVSIIYGNFENDNNLLPIDIFQSYGLIKSSLYSKLYNIDIIISIPKWNRFNYIYDGIFISTELDDITNSCIGIFQNNDKITSANKIMNSTKGSLNDSIVRWNNPITIDNLNKLNIKIEIIDDISKWKCFNSNTCFDNFNLESNQGMYLKLYNNKTSTFLPSVAENNKNIWSIEDYMNTLSLKSGSSKDFWKHNDSIMYIYKTKNIKYISNLNIINFS